MAKLGVSITQAARSMLDPLTLTTFDVTHGDTEERRSTLVLSRDGLLLALFHTCQVSGPASVKVSLISARNATRRERGQYQNVPQSAKTMNPADPDDMPAEILDAHSLA